MTVDQNNVERLARNLLDACRTHAKDGEVVSFMSCISGVIEAIDAGKITQPMDWAQVPCSLYFSEGDLSKYKDIELAYSELKIELTGGPSDTLAKMRRGEL